MQVVSLKIGTATPKSLVVEPKPLDKLFKLYAFSQGGVLMTTQRDKAKIKNDVLTDNTAQTVRKYLNELESNRASMHTRWIWELLQNARDASMGTDSLIATVQCLPNELTFLHNGKGFTDCEIAHLIFASSTKIEEEETIGQYGSGFLTTHLLSSVVEVSGELDDSKWFNFRLERKPGTVDELRKSMEQAYDDFSNCTPSLQGPIPDCFTTRFVYPVEDDARDAVEKGIAMLKQCAPFVVVFNQEFSRINIENRGETMCFEVVERPPLDSEGIQQITVAESTDGNRRERKYLLAQGQETSVAIPLESDGDSSVCSPIEDTPRLFLGFPLVGTESFSFPAVINSFKFTPTENRDGVYLGKGENDANIRNQAVIEEACELLGHLLQRAASSGWRNAHLLVEVPNSHIPEKPWLDQNWFRECLKAKLIEKVRQTPAVLTEASNAIAPKNAMLPLAKNDAGVEVFWDLLDISIEYRERLPRSDEAAGWCKAINSWASVADLDASEFGVDGAQLARRVDDRCSSLADLQNWLQENVCAVDWLNRLYGFLIGNEFEAVIRNRRFVPNQVGEFHQLSTLYRDLGISEELKNIAKLLGWRIRRKLRDIRLTSLGEETGKGDWDGEYVVGKLVEELKKRARENPDNNFKEASARLFAWIVNQKDWDRLQGFPVFAEDGNSDSFSCLYLPSAAQDSEPPLAPVSSWQGGLETFADLFPPNRIVADAFFEVLPKPDTWGRLNEQNLVRMDMIICRNEKVNFKDFSSEEDLEDRDHKAVEPVTVIDIVEREKIMERVSDSRSRAHLLWQFLTERIIRKADLGLEFKKARCGCGDSHKYSPAAWLMPVRNNKWIREKDKRSPANAQSLASLLRDSGWDSSSLNQNPEVVKLLQAIGVSQFDLMRGFMTESDEERSVQESVLTEILVASGDNLSRVPELVQYMANDEHLLQHLEERRKRIRIVRENQYLGQKVEALVRENLERVGFSVNRTGTGSDFEISGDTADLGRLDVVRDSQSWLVEVKSTQTQSVQMSSEQSKTAVEKGEEFLLCIVPVELGNVPDAETVRTNMRFIKNIRLHVARQWKDLNFLKEWREEIANEAASDGIKPVVDAGSPKIEVTRSAWESEGFSLEDLAENL